MHGVNLNTNGSSVLTSNDFNYGIFNIGSDPDMKMSKQMLALGCVVMVFTMRIRLQR